MQEKDLIRQLKTMREIKPRKEWVALTKNQILGEEETKPSFAFPVFGWKWALAPVLAVLTVVGLLTVSWFLPGEEIRVAEEPEPAEEDFAVAGESEKLAQQPELEKVPDLAEMLKKTEELSLTLDYLSETIKINPELTEAVTKDIEKVEEELAYLGQSIAQLSKSRQPEQTEEVVEKPEIGQEIEELIAFFETRTLNDEQQELLEAAKAAYEAADFDQALVKLLEI